MPTPNAQDYGFGTRVIKAGHRLINEDGSFNIIRKGKGGWNSYQALINLSHSRFNILMALFFIGLNLLFSGLFMLVGVEQFNGIPPGNYLSNFLYTFFFSVQTFTTVGYGGMNPIGITANFISSLCATIGLVWFAVMTGLFFARFSQPRSHINFSNVALLTPFQDMMSFQFRIVHSRRHKIVNLSARVNMTWIESINGNSVRKFSELSLERSEIVMFPLNWTLVHPITPDSPLYQKNQKDLKAMQAEFLISLSGFDENYNQILHTNRSYICNEIIENMRFKPMYVPFDDRPTELYLNDLNELLPVAT